MLIEIPSQVNTALTALGNGGFKAYAVGGAVRDSIRGCKASDWDIAASSLPEQTEKIFKDYRVIETGIKHGTVTVIIDGMPLEITTMRVDGDYSDSRRPDSVEFTADITADLSRRDFTVNAIAYNPAEGLIDPFGGAEDIKRGIIRCVGNPDIRFGEDALRIMRALRFACVLGYEIDASTAQSVLKNRALLNNIARERIANELVKLLCGDSVKDILMQFDEVIFEIIPALRALKGCGQNSECHCFDVWEHTVSAVASVPPLPVLRTAMLLHDCAKPACKKTDENGVDSFPGHAAAGEIAAREILKGLKLSNKFITDVCTLIRYHDIEIEYMSDSDLKRWLGFLGNEYFLYEFDIDRADISAQAPEHIDRLIAVNANQNKVHKLIENDSCVTIAQLKVGGGDITALGAGGKQVGRILDELLNQVIEEKVPNEKVALLAKARKLIN